MRIALIIPTLNAEEHLSKLFPALEQQTLKPDVLLIIDRGSEDNTVELSLNSGAQVEVIEPGTFNHGGTRRMASEMVNADICIFMTQDCMPANNDSLELLFIVRLDY